MTAVVRTGFKVGDRIRVYHEVRRALEVCSHGENHPVPIYAVKVITVARVEVEEVKALHYTSDGWGEVLYAVDAQRRRYRKAPHWDGPRASLWVRDRSIVSTWDQYPPHKFSRDLTGRVLPELLAVHGG